MNEGVFPMNIALFADCYEPIKNGVVTAMRTLKETLESQGHSVYVVTVHVKGEADNDPAVYRVPALPVGRGSEQCMGFPSLKKIYRFLKDKRIDIVHAHTEFMLGKAGMKVAKRLGVPGVYTMHTLWEDYMHYFPFGNTALFKRFFRAYWRDTAKRADAATTVAEKSKKRLLTLMKGETPLPIAVIYNGLDFKTFCGTPATAAQKNALRKKLGIAETDALLVFIGRLGIEKRIKELHEAALPFLKENKTLKFLIVGDGIALEPMKKRTKEEGLERQCIFTGFIPWQNLSLYYSIGDVFVNASLSEANSLTVIEAARSGLPVVTRDDESFYCIIEDNKNGYLVDSDKKVIEKAILLAKNKAKRKAFSLESEKKARLFSAEYHAERMLTFYRITRTAYPKRPAQAAVAAAESLHGIQRNAPLTAKPKTGIKKATRAKRAAPKTAVKKTAKKAVKKRR